MKVINSLCFSGILLALFLISIPQTFAVTVSTEMKVEPSPVIAGSSASIILSVKAVGGEAWDVKATIIKSEIPFTPASILLGDIGEDEVQQALFKLMVPENQEEGTYQVEILINFNSNSFHRFAKVDVENPKHKPVLELVNVSVEKETINPGDSFQIIATIRNVGLEDARNVRVTWEQEVFSPKDPNRKNIGEIGVGEKKEVSFEITVNREIEPKSYPIRFKIQYEDSKGIEQEPTILATGIDVGGGTEILLSGNLRKVRAGSTNEFEVMVANVGPVDANSLTLKLIEEYPFEVIGSKEAFIGTLRSDDFDFSSFTLSVDENASGTATLPIEVTYKDAFSKTHSFIKKISIDILPSKGVTPFQSFLQPTFIIFIIVVVSLLFYIVYRSRKRK